MQFYHRELGFKLLRSNLKPVRGSVLATARMEVASPTGPPAGAAASQPRAEGSAGWELITLLGGSENRRAEELSREVKQCLSRGPRRSAPASLPAFRALDRGVGWGGEGSPARFPEALGLPSSKGRQAAGSAEAFTLIGASALDAGLLCPPAGTNSFGREKRGARQQGAQSTNKKGALVRVCLYQTDRPTPARRLAH